MRIFQSVDHLLRHGIIADLSVASPRINTSYSIDLSGQLWPATRGLFADKPEEATATLADAVRHNLSDPQLKATWRFFDTNKIANIGQLSVFEAEGCLHAHYFSFSMEPSCYVYEVVVQGFKTRVLAEMLDLSPGLLTITGGVVASSAAKQEHYERIDWNDYDPPPFLRFPMNCPDQLTTYNNHAEALLKQSRQGTLNPVAVANLLGTNTLHSFLVTTWDEAFKARPKPSSTQVKAK